MADRCSCFTVRAVINPDHYARIEVQDDGGPWNQGMIDPARHHGLDIVRTVADEWGIDGDHIGRTIWARLAGVVATDLLPVDPTALIWEMA